MNTQQLIDAIKAATKTLEIVTSCGTGWNHKEEVSYIDADAFLAAVERLASVPDSLKDKL